MPDIQEFHEFDFDPDEAIIVGVAHSATEGEIRALIDEQDLTFPNIFDINNHVVDAYGAESVPHYVFLDRYGRIAHRIPGAPHDSWEIHDRLFDLKYNDG